MKHVCEKGNLESFWRIFFCVVFFVSCFLGGTVEKLFSNKGCEKRLKKFFRKRFEKVLKQHLRKKVWKKRFA